MHQLVDSLSYTQLSLISWFIIFHSNIIALRNKYKDEFLKKHGVKLGFMSPFVRAAAYALQDQPVVNAGENLRITDMIIIYSGIPPKMRTPL